MACPNRRNKMVCNMIANKKIKEKESKIETEEKIISEEEHRERMRKLKEMGLIK